MLDKLSPREREIVQLVAIECHTSKEAALRALPEKNESGGIPLRARIRFKNRTGRQASMRWGSRIQRICVSA